MDNLFPRLWSLFALCAFASASMLFAQAPQVLTAEYDSARTTANNQETILNPFNVNAKIFGKVGSYSVDGQVVGQPLYMPHMFINYRFVNVLYVATMNNTVYALDADHPGTAPLWKVNLGPAVPVGYSRGVCPAGYATGNQLGILSTPVIDPGHNAIYLVAASPIPNSPSYLHTLYALDLVTGQQTEGGSEPIVASVPGSGSQSSGGIVTLGQTNMIQRPALLFANDAIYVGLSGCGPDPSPYHGWVLGYSADNIKRQTAVYNSTPNGDEGGIWQAGRGLVGDNFGSVYFETGNGSTDDRTDFGESIVKMSATGSVQDWFTPNDYVNLSALDLDLSTTSPLLTPDTNLLIGGGKQGLVYVLRASSLGRLGGALQTFAGGTPCAAVQSGCQKIHSLAYWSGFGVQSRLYVWETNDTLRAYRYQYGQFTADSQGSQASAYPGGILTVTSSSRNPFSGIVWALTPGELHAFSATNVAQELWNSNQNPGRDALSGNFHFEQYTVVNGRVYVPDSQNHVVVYGLLY